MSEITGIVDVQIDPESAATTAKSFGVALFVGKAKSFAASDSTKWRVRLYTSAAGVKADFLTTDPEYKAAARYFGQTPRPQKLLIGQVWDSEGYNEAITAITQENPAWFACAIDSRTNADVKAVSDLIQADMSRIFFSAVAGDDVVKPKTGTGADAASNWYATRANNRTKMIYRADASTEYAEMAYIGFICTHKPGSYTPVLKQLVGVTADKLTDDIKNNLWNKGVDTYTEVGGVNILEGGKTNFEAGTAEEGGEWLDVIIFAIWCQARVSEGIYNVMLANDKIPYTDEGAEILAGPIRDVMEEGITVKGISPHEFDSTKTRIGGYELEIVDPTTLPASTKKTRKYNGLTCTFFLAGAIHFVGVRLSMKY